MNKNIKIILIFAALVLLAVSLAFAQEEKPKKDSVKAFMDKLDISCGVYEEYDDNIFYEPTKRDWDLKTIITPSIYYEDHFGDIRLGVGHRAEITYYERFPEWIHTQKTDAAVSYSPNSNFSIGLSDSHLHASQGEVMYKDVGVERVLRLGYNVNSAIAETKFKLAPYLATRINYEHDYVNFSDHVYNTYLDRLTDMWLAQQDFLLPHEVTLSGGFKYKVQDFTHDPSDGKSYDGFEIYAGAEKKFLRLFTVSGQAGFERRNFSEGKADQGFTLRTNLATNFSRFTTVTLGYSRGLADSSRSDFRQYRSDLISASVSHYFTPKLIAFLNGSYEIQTYNDKDMFRPVLWPGKRRSQLYSCDAVVRYILTKNLSLEAAYSYSKRDTDFEREGYRENRYKVGCRASF